MPRYLFCMYLSLIVSQVEIQLEMYRWMNSVGSSTTVVSLEGGNLIIMFGTVWNVAPVKCQTLPCWSVKYCLGEKCEMLLRWSVKYCPVKSVKYCPSEKCEMLPRWKVWNISPVSPVDHLHAVKGHLHIDQDRKVLGDARGTVLRNEISFSGRQALTTHF